MDTVSLVNTNIEDSIELVKQLDASNDSPAVVAWYYYEDAEEWKLLISGPKFDRLLETEPALAYRKIVDAIDSAAIKSLTISDIKLMGTDEPLIDGALRRLIKTESQMITNAHFRGLTINGIYISAVTILRSCLI